MSGVSRATIALKGAEVILKERNFSDSELDALLKARQAIDKASIIGRRAGSSQRKKRIIKAINEAEDMDPGVKKKLTIDLQGVFKITDEIDDKSLGLDEVKKESLENASIAKAELNKYKGDSLKAEIIKNVLIKQGFCNPCNLKDRNNPLMCSVECKNKLWNKGFSKNRKKNQRRSQQ